jgi:hypothetical protein
MSKELVINRTPGRPFGTTKYDEAVHVQLLYDVFSSGRGVMGFCAESSICRKTFFNWLKQYKEFKDAYDIVINIAGDKWEQLPLTLLNDGKPFNFQYWHLIMRNRFHYSGLNIPKRKNKTTEGKFKSAWKGLERGSLSSQEYNQIMQGIVAELKSRELDIRVQEIEQTKKQKEREKEVDCTKYTDNQLREHVKLIEAVKAGKEVKVIVLENEPNQEQPHETV